jgi:hypothetical protein
VDGKILSILEDLSAKFDQLQRQMRELKAKQNQSPLPRRQTELNRTSETQKLCYFCGKQGQLRKECRAYKAHIMVTVKLTKVQPGHRCCFCRKQFSTEDEWNEHTIQCAKERRKKLTFAGAKCDYAAKRDRDLTRHTETHHRADSREKTDQGKNLGDLHEFIGPVNLSKKPAAAGAKAKEC